MNVPPPNDPVFNVQCASVPTRCPISEFRGAILSREDRNHRFAGFTLVEMLAVMGIIVLLLAATGPALNALKGAGDVNKAVYDIAGLIQQARAYAMANNTYTYLGIAEVDANTSTDATPQVAGTGRIGMAVIAAKDGTRGYQLSDLASGMNAITFQNDMTVVGRLLVFENIHLADLGNPRGGNMVRPVLKADGNGFRYNLADSNCVSVTPFNYPLGASATTARYSFQKVVQFDPQGVARIQTARNADTVTPVMEIGLVQTHGTIVPALTTPVTQGNVAATQIDGVNGSTRIYRP